MQYFGERHVLNIIMKRLNPSQCSNFLLNFRSELTGLFGHPPIECYNKSSSHASNIPSPQFQDLTGLIEKGREERCFDQCTMIEP